MSRLSSRKILELVQSGQLSVDEALERLSQSELEDIGFAVLDHQREERKGFPEVVYCEGKTVDQSVEILKRLAGRATTNVLGTRADVEVYERLKAQVDGAQYYESSRTILVRRGEQRAEGLVTIVAAGTSDLPVAEEAAITCEAMGSHVDRVYDVGVAGLHRLLRQLPRIRQARVLIACAGMEGALASVLTGLVDKPVIALPTSVGYGAQFQGLTPLLSMLSSCASGMAVVNIDNGFGAGYIASMINRLGN